MATKVFETKEIELQNGLEITLRPLTIKNLRKFMEKVSELQDEEVDELEAIDKMVEVSIFAIQACGNDFESDEIEDGLDMPTINEVLEVAGGVKFGDPNQMGGLAGRI